MEQRVGNTWAKSSIVEVKAKFFGQTLHVKLHISNRMLDGCAVRPMKASVAAKHANKMLALLWSCGVFLTVIITKMLSRMVSGQVVVVMIICIINTTCSGSCNCKFSADTYTFLEKLLKSISDMFVIMVCFGGSHSFEIPTVPLCFAQNTYFSAKYNEAAYSRLLNSCQ